MNTYSDKALLRRWCEQRDALAFKELTRRYGGLVFSAANRVLANAADAEDIAQECFVKLATAPPEPRRSLAAWLHTVAVRGAIDRVRQDTRRRQREVAYEAAFPRATNTDLDDLLSHVDEAIAMLPESHRDCVVGHFLRDVDQARLAEELGLSRWTVRRRTKEGVAQVRALLGRRGIVTGAGVVEGVLGGLNSDALPTALSELLGKVAVAGLEGTGSAANAGPAVSIIGGSLLMKNVVVVATYLTIMAIAMWWYFSQGIEGSISVGPTVLKSDMGMRSTDALSPGDTEPLGLASSQEALSVGDKRDEPEDTAAGKGGLFTINTPGSFLLDPEKMRPEPVKDPTKFGSVSGLVLDQHGRGIPGAEVLLLLAGELPLFDRGMNPALALLQQATVERLWSEAPYQYSAVSDATGAFSISDIKYSGMGVLVARASGFEPKPDGCRVIPEEIAEITIILNTARAIYGRVVTPSGAPVAGASVVAMGQVSERSARGTVQIPEAARIRTDGSGEFSIWLGETGEEQTSTGLHIMSATHGEAFFAPVAVGLDERITFTLEPQVADLNGRITTGAEVPAAGFHLVLTSQIRLSNNAGSSTGGNGPVYETIIDPNGHYEIEEVAVFASYVAYLFTPDGTQVAQQSLPGLRAGEPNVWNYAIDPPIEVTGILVGRESKTPIAGAYVFYSSENAGNEGNHVTGHTSTDAAGSFKLSLISGAGTYIFTPRLRRDSISDDDTEFAHSHDLKPGETLYMELELPLPWSRTFQLVDQFGHPVDGVESSMMQYQGQNTLGTSRSERSDFNGMVTFGLLPADAETAFTFHRDRFVSATSDRKGGAAGEVLAPEVFVLYQGASAAARLVDGAGNPVGDVGIQCIATYGDGRNTTVASATNGDGWFLIEEALPGTTVNLQIRVEGGDDSGHADNIGAIVTDIELTPNTLNGLGEITVGP